jgi:hypothetical protein
MFQIRILKQARIIEMARSKREQQDEKSGWDLHPPRADEDSENRFNPIKPVCFVSPSNIWYCFESATANPVHWRLGRTRLALGGRVSDLEFSDCFEDMAVAADRSSHN